MTITPVLGRQYRGCKQPWEVADRSTGDSSHGGIRHGQEEGPGQGRCTFGRCQHLPLRRNNQCCGNVACISCVSSVSDGIARPGAPSCMYLLVMMSLVCRRSLRTIPSNASTCNRWAPAMRRRRHIVAPVRDVQGGSAAVRGRHPGPLCAAAGDPASPGSRRRGLPEGTVSNALTA